VTFPHSPQPGPRPGPPPPGAFRPGPPPGGGGFRPGAPVPPRPESAAPAGVVEPGGGAEPGRLVTETGHPAVDAVLQSLANASRLAPSAQIAEYEAAYQVLQETLANIDR
jgi:hypothetical protein